MFRRALTCLAVATVMTAISSVVSAAGPIVLKYGEPGPPTASIYTDLVRPWAQKVNKEAGGALKVKVFVGYSLVNMVNTLDRVENGVADIAFMILGPVSSQFPQTLVASLPFVADNGHEAGLALQRLYDKGIISDEWKGVKPLAFGVFANVGYHTVPMVKDLAGLKGLKISVQSRIAGNTLEALGGTPISLPINEVYEALQRGTIQGASIGWPATCAFKLTDVVKNHLFEPLGGEEAVMVMNKNTYARLSGKAKQVIDANIGTVFTNWFNKVTDDSAQQCVDQVQHMKGQTISRLTPAQRALWKKRVEPVIAQWEKHTPNGARVLAAFRKEVAAIRAGH